MKKFLLPAGVFLLIFFCGTGFILFLREPGRNMEKSSSGTSVRLLSRDTGSGVLPPLQLPPGITAQRCPENSWEYSGEISANFVSARGRLSAWFQNQSWRPEKQITLDASLKPRVILTFSNGEYELTLLIWKIGTDLTGFSYRRDKKSDFEGEIIQ